MKSRWIETEEGLYFEIMDPDPEVIEVLRGRDLTDREKIQAMRRYVEKRYLESTADDWYAEQQYLGDYPDELDRSDEVDSGDSSD